MPLPRTASLVRAGFAVALLLVSAACTAGGQFDPTEVFSADIFNTKKKIQGDREPLFPNGVPGAETGVPPDLVKGYQPPPEQSADSEDAAAKAAAPPPAPARAEAKPKPKPRPKIARAPAQPAPTRGAQDPVWNQKAASPSQTNWPAPHSAQTNWPAPPSSQGGQTNWPAPPSQPPQTNWPAPPSGGQSH